MINSGSVVGKTLAYGVRALASVRFVLVNSTIASLIALGLSVFVYTDPERGRVENPPSFWKTLRGYGEALANLRFTGFLIVAAGFYFMVEQYYMTFPKYVTRHIDEKAPLEIITLINPAVIAIFQGRVTSLFARVPPFVSMACGVFTAALAMFVMGVAPGLIGACCSGAIFAVSEMMFSPPFYATMANFAPEGKAGMYMGLAFVPFAIGAWIGGMVSGPLIARYLPEKLAEHAVRSPFTVWSTYAACGLACAILMSAYALFARTKPAAETSAA
jgi:POT family proton-dependent oligopeptide transporter